MSAVRACIVVCSLVYSTQLYSFEWGKNVFKSVAARLFTQQQSSEKEHGKEPESYEKRLKDELTTLLPLPTVLIELVAHYAARFPEWRVEKRWNPQWGEFSNVLAWDPSGAFLVHGGDEGGIMVLRSDSYEHDKCYKKIEKRSGITAIAFSPEGAFREPLFATASKDHTVRIWNFSYPVCLQVLHDKGSVSHVMWSPCGKHLVSIDLISASVWDVRSGKLEENLKLPVFAHGCIWTNEGIFIAGSEKGKESADDERAHDFQIFNLRTNTYMQSFSGHTGVVRKVVWSPDRRYVASSGHDETIRIWNARSGACIRTFPESAVSSYDIAWSPCSTFIAAQAESVTMQPLLGIWNIANGKWLHSFIVNFLDHHSSRTKLTSIAWSPCGKKIIASRNNGSFIALESNDSPMAMWNHYGS